MHLTSVQQFFAGLGVTLPLLLAYAAGIGTCLFLIRNDKAAQKGPPVIVLGICIVLAVLLYVLK